MVKLGSQCGFSRCFDCCEYSLLSCWCCAVTYVALFSQLVHSISADYSEARSLDLNAINSLLPYLFLDMPCILRRSLS
jgi:hypothetical protein